MVILLAFSMYPANTPAATPVSGEWVNVFNISGISISYSPSGATMVFTNATQNQRVSTVASRNINGLSMELTNLSVPSGQRISLALVNSIGGWHDSKSLFFIIDPNATSSAVVVSPRNVAGLADLYFSTSSILGNTININLVKANAGTWKFTVNQQTFDIPDTYFSSCLDNVDASYLSMGNWNWSGGNPVIQYTIHDVSSVLSSKTPVYGDWVNVWGIGGISANYSADGVAIAFSNAAAGQRISYRGEKNLNGLALQLKNLNVPSGQKISIGFSDSLGGWSDNKSLFFIIDPNETLDSITISPQSISGLPNLYFSTTAPLTASMNLTLIKSNDTVWKLIINGETFDIPEEYFRTCLNDYNNSYVSLGNWNWSGGSPTVQYTVEKMFSAVSMDNSSLIPAIQPQNEVTVDANGTPSWVSNLMIANFRLEMLTNQDGDNNLINEGKKIIDHYAEMGINALWLNPVFERDPGPQNTNIGYCIKNNECIEQDIVGTSDKNAGRKKFKELVDYAHSKNVRIFLDMLVWGTATNNPLVTSNPNFYKTSGGAFVPGWGGYLFNWNSTELKTWYKNYALSLVADMGIDGFRCDLEPFGASSDIWVDIQNRAWTDCGRRIAIFSEIANKNRQQFDFEQLGVGPPGLVSHGSQEYFLQNNIVDCITTGTGIGDQSLSSSTKGTYQYYTNCITCHDTGATDTTTRDYSAHRNPLILGYQAIFAPFIPIWYAGEEWDNPYSQVPSGGGTLYFTTYQLSLREKEGNKQFYEDTKRMLRIRRLYPEIFNYFPANHRNANIVKVTATNLTQQAYGRYASGKGILVLPNNSGTKVVSNVTIPFAAMGLNGARYRVYDLMNDILVGAGTPSELASLSVQVLGTNLRILLVEPDDSSAPGPQISTGLPLFRMNTAHKGTYTAAAQICDYWNQGIAINAVQDGVSIGISNADGSSWARRATTRQQYKLDGLTIKIKNVNLGSGKFTFGLYNIDTPTSGLGKWVNDTKTVMFIFDKVDGSYGQGGILLGRYGQPETGSEYFTGYKRFYAPIENEITITFKKLPDTTWSFTINGESIVLTQQQLTLNSGSVQRGLTDLDHVFIDFGLWSGSSQDSGSYTIHQIYTGVDGESL